jgi:hypothetical protein
VKYLDHSSSRNEDPAKDPASLRAGSKTPAALRIWAALARLAGFAAAEPAGRGTASAFASNLANAGNDNASGEQGGLRHDRRKPPRRWTGHGGKVRGSDRVFLFDVGRRTGSNSGIAGHWFHSWPSLRPVYRCVRPGLVSEMGI